MIWLTVAAIILTPLLMFAMDTAAGVRTRKRTYRYSGLVNGDYTILVPIWGNIKYLENIEYLSAYGRRVVLCTTGDESPEFNRAITEVCQKYGFGLFIDQPVKTAADQVAVQASQRSTSGTIRDQVIRNALATVQTAYVIPLDADSTTVENMSVLVGELRRQKFDIASIRIVPRNSDSVFAKMQAYEYDLAMRFRFLSPWLVSGACHVAQTAVLREIMNRHSLFFQGNDVETGLLAKSLGYKVGHIPFVVETTVPSTFKAWFRQRLAWSGGEFRLFIVNFKFAYRHPFFWFYGGVVTIAALPLRWVGITSFSYQLGGVLLLYAAMVLYMHWEKKSPWLILMPLYTLFLSLVMAPLGVFWYFHMAKKDQNYGIIRPNRA